MINILGKIDLESLPQERRRFRAEKYKPILDEKIANLSSHLNKEYGEVFEDDLSISLNNEEDKSFIDEREDTWSREMGKSKEKWLEDKELNKSSLAETGISLVLDKVIGEDFVVCRSSKYDDYKHGVDNIILDKETGNIVCGFDDVLGHRGDDGGEYKKNKIKKIMEKGGVNLKQGLGFKDDGSLEIKRLYNLPAFYLSISKEDLETLLEGLGEEDKDKVSDFEKSIIFKFVNSLEFQLKDLNTNNFNDKLGANILKFKDSLEKIKKLL